MGIFGSSQASAKTQEESKFLSWNSNCTWLSRWLKGQEIQEVTDETIALKQEHVVIVMDLKRGIPDADFEVAYTPKPGFSTKPRRCLATYNEEDDTIEFVAYVPYTGNCLKDFECDSHAFFPLLTIKIGARQ